MGVGEDASCDGNDNTYLSSHESHSNPHHSLLVSFHCTPAVLTSALKVWVGGEPGEGVIMDKGVITATFWGQLQVRRPQLRLVVDVR